MMYTRYITQVLLWITAMVFGPVGYFLARYTHIGEGIWGNSVDGWSGDPPYRGREAQEWFRKYWPDFWWSVIRNPANNLARSMKAEGKVLSITHKGNLKVVSMDNGKKYFFYYTPNSRLMFKLGWKLWDSTTLIDFNVDAKLAFSLQRGK